MLPKFFCAALALLLLLSRVAAQDPNWPLILPQGSAPQSLDSPPHGCTCADSSSPCTRFDCPCTCNLLAGQCDAGCCCDPDCSAVEVASYANSQACLPTGSQNKTIVRCVDSTAIVAVNPKARCVGLLGRRLLLAVRLACASSCAVQPPAARLHAHARPHAHTPPHTPAPAQHGRGLCPGH